jgi:SAM-dependent methyltransferase
MTSELHGSENIEQPGMFSKVSYWDTRYSKGANDGEEAEWIFNFDSIKRFLCLETARFIIDVGCGVSPLLNEIRLSGYAGKALGIDFSTVAIYLARAKFETIEYVCADAASILSIAGAENVDIVIDKTSIDSQLCAGPVGRANVTRYCEAVGRALREEGVFIWATFQGLEPYGMEIVNGTILPGLTASSSFHGFNWAADIHIWEDAVFSNPDLKPTVYIFRKVHRSPRFLGDDVNSLETVMHYH